MPSASLPIPIKAVLADLDAAETHAAEIIEGISDQQANWRPADHAWTILQCLAHLSRINRIYAAAMYEAVAKQEAIPSTVDRSDLSHESGISPGWFAGRFIRSMEPPVRTRMKAPTKSIPPAEIGDPRQVLAEFIESHKAIRGVVESSSQLDLNSVRFKNPFIGVLRFTVGSGLLIVNAHDRRHLWQANQVKLAPGFPPQ